MSSSFTDGTTAVVVLVVDGYQVSRQGRNTFNPILGGGQDVWLQPADLRSGTLTAIVTNLADAYALLTLFSATKPVTFSDSDVPLASMTFVLNGSASIEQSDDVISLPDSTATYTYAVSVDFQEIAS